ncbi:hypothetical protein L7F22_032886 [Adiantum nelumboides]|nr:hypothetical protein [Adiantum nelumboides]
MLAHTLFILALVAAPLTCKAQAADDYIQTSAAAPMAKSEEEAFYKVMQAINYEVDWRTLYPDPCGGSSPQGSSCDEVGGLWHLTSLSFGPVYENTPPCGRNASIDSSIVQLTHLKSLSFYRCFTQANTSIPSEVASLKASLKSLTLRDNGALGGGIPAAFGGLLKLERLIITGAKIEGSIPWELGQLQQLVQLDLSNNKLGGFIPSSLGKSLGNLVVLVLSNNCLIGNIPPSLGGLARMEKLDISRNMLVGRIPLEMGFLERLNLMDMSSNKLEGNIPSSFAGLARLQRLDLSHNSFKGALLNGVWGSLRHLMSLDLSNAGFEGPIPSSFASLESLRSLSLSNNKLSGGVPRGLGALSHLCSLHLSGNNLSGQLPFTPAFVEKLGSNLLLYGNKELCSMVPIVKPGVNNVRLCSNESTSDDQIAHQLSSTSTSLSHLQNGAPCCRPRPFQSTLLYALLIIILF